MTAVDIIVLSVCLGSFEGQVTPEQDHLLKNAFSLLDLDGDGKLGEDEFRSLLRLDNTPSGTH